MPFIEVSSFLIGLFSLLIGAGLTILIYNSLLNRKKETVKNMLDKAKNNAENNISIIPLNLFSINYPPNNIPLKIITYENNVLKNIIIK